MKPSYRYNWKKRKWERVFITPSFIRPKSIMPQKTFEIKGVEQ